MQIKFSPNKNPYCRRRALDDDDKKLINSYFAAIREYANDMPEDTYESMISIAVQLNKDGLLSDKQFNFVETVYKKYCNDYHDDDDEYNDK